MNKFLPLLLLFFSFLLVSPTAVFAQTASLTLGPAGGTFNRGCNFYLAVELDTGGAPTDGTDAVLFYDPSRLTVTSITNGTIYPEYAGNSIDSQRGTVSISGYVAADTNFSGKGTLATVNFTVPNTAPTGVTQVTFDFDPNNKAKTIDSNVVILQEGSVLDVLNSVVNGSYVIGTGSCNAQASPTPTPRPGTPGSTVVVPPGTVATGGPGGQGTVYGTPAAQAKTLDQFVDGTGKGPGTPQLTFTLAIIGSVLTVLGILGLALL